MSKLGLLINTPSNGPPGDSTNNFQVPQRRAPRSYYDAGVTSAGNEDPITTQQRQPYVSALNTSGLALSRLRKVPPTENLSGTSALTVFLFFYTGSSTSSLYLTIKHAFF